MERTQGPCCVQSGVMAAEHVDIVHAWHDALNAGDIEHLVALSSNDIEVGGPRGSGHGAALLRQWFDRAGIYIEPRQFFHRGQTVVVEQYATWHAPEAGTSADPQGVASVFVVRGGRVASVTRYADLASALEASGLTEADHA